MNYELLFPSQYLRACDLQGREVTVVIEGVELATLPLRGTSQTKKRGVVKLRGKDKMIVLNRTNAETIAKLYGKDTDEWLGKPITLYSARVTFGRETVDAIRIRDKAPEAA